MSFLEKLLLLIFLVVFAQIWKSIAGQSVEMTLLIFILSFLIGGAK